MMIILLIVIYLINVVLCTGLVNAKFQYRLHYERAYKLKNNPTAAVDELSDGFTWGLMFGLMGPIGLIAAFAEGGMGYYGFSLHSEPAKYRLRVFYPKNTPVRSEQ